MLIDDIKEYRTELEGKDSVFIIIRHAEKEIKSPEKDVSGLLTPKGLQDSREFGKYLHRIFDNSFFIKTSPIQRCIQTANQMASDGVKIIESNILGDPGVFVPVDKLAFDNFLTILIFKDSPTIPRTPLDVKTRLFIFILNLF